jgi:thiol:disulfide interchange protein DsbG
MAQDKEPPLPAPIQTLQEQGAQVRYLGRHNGLDGWITIKNGQEQYFYATQDGKSLLMGLLFDIDGKLVTVRQVKELQDKGGGVLDALAQAVPEDAAAAETRFKPLQNSPFKTPAEQLFSDVSATNWIVLGNPEAPVIYSFMDPQCPHCHDFMDDLKKNYIDRGVIQVRMIPVGLRDETRAQSAFLLASPDPETRWYKHLAGDKSALPVARGVNQQGVERNMAVMQSWKLDATPLTVYRGKDGQVKIVQGRPTKISDLIADLPPPGTKAQ